MHRLSIVLVDVVYCGGGCIHNCAQSYSLKTQSSQACIASCVCMCDDVDIFRLHGLWTATWSAGGTKRPCRSSFPRWCRLKDLPYVRREHRTSSVTVRLSRVCRRGRLPIVGGVQGLSSRKHPSLHPQVLPGLDVPNKRSHGDNVRNIWTFTRVTIEFEKGGSPATRVRQTCVPTTDCHHNSR